MESLVFLPSSFGPRCGCSCDCRTGHGLGPLRPRYQFRRRWQPAAVCGLTPPRSFLSQLFEDDDEPSFPSLVLRLRDNCREKRGASTPENKDSQKPQQVTDKKTVPENEKTDSDEYKLSMELGDLFAPNEISVKLVGRTLRVEAKREGSGANGHFSRRQLSRVINLPDDVDIEKLTSSYSTEGVLSIVAPKLPAKESIPAERAIPIEQTAAEKGTTGEEEVIEAASQGTSDSEATSKAAPRGASTDSGASEGASGHGEPTTTAKVTGEVTHEAGRQEPAKTTKDSESG